MTTLGEEGQEIPNFWPFRLRIAPNKVLRLQSIARFGIPNFCPLGLRIAPNKVLRLQSIARFGIF